MSWGDSRGDAPSIIILAGKRAPVVSTAFRLGPTPRRRFSGVKNRGKRRLLILYSSDSRVDSFLKVWQNNLFLIRCESSVGKCLRDASGRLFYYLWDNVGWIFADNRARVSMMPVGRYRFSEFDTKCMNTVREVTLGNGFVVLTARPLGMQPDKFLFCLCIIIPHTKPLPGGIGRRKKLKDQNPLKVFKSFLNSPRDKIYLNIIE